MDTFGELMTELLIDQGDRIHAGVSFGYALKKAETTSGENTGRGDANKN